MASITVSEELRRKAEQLSIQGNTSENALSFMPCIILNFVDNKNICNVLLQSGTILESIKCKNTIEEILFRYGTLKDLKSIPAVLYYKITPDSGFCELGDIFLSEERPSQKTVSRPFYI